MKASTTFFALTGFTSTALSAVLTVRDPQVCNGGYIYAGKLSEAHALVAVGADGTWDGSQNRKHLCNGGNANTWSCKADGNTCIFVRWKDLKGENTAIPNKDIRDAAQEIVDTCGAKSKDDHLAGRTISGLGYVVCISNGDGCSSCWSGPNEK